MRAAPSAPTVRVWSLAQRITHWALASCVIGCVALYETDRFWGDPVVYALHQIGGWAFVLLAPLHVAGVVLASRRHGENLVAAMVHGRKRAAAGDDRP